MLSDSQTKVIAAIAAMSAHHGTYDYLCETGGAPFLAHSPVGHELYHYHKPAV